jgi:beta-ribofuranosylaminobenzene 5'-phosphate synthase
MSVRVVAPCRLHFGLFHVPVDGLTHHPDGRPVRKFGGLGLMIDQPCVTVKVIDVVGPRSISGTLAMRATAVLYHLEKTCAIAPFITYMKADGPPEHVGLGVGTALGMAIAFVANPEHWAFDHVFSSEALTDERLARLAGRGKRSGIGVEGFSNGGFIADDGKVSDEELPYIADRLDFPAPWRVVLVRPPTPPVWYGDRERTAFARTRPADRALSLTDRLRSLAYDAVVPAVRNADFDTFAASIFEFNRLAGEPFHDDQGGPYASPEVACVIDELIEMGAVGVGQSSWGPTVFAFARSADEADHLAKRARERFSSATDVTVTAANNTGARLETGERFDTLSP